MSKVVGVVHARRVFVLLLSIGSIVFGQVTLYGRGRLTVPNNQEQEYCCYLYSPDSCASIGNDWVCEAEADCANQMHSHSWGECGKLAVKIKM